jgi:CelD/BcsL family acetyltransferase involved in cellulose biosynthesis
MSLQVTTPAPRAIWQRLMSLDREAIPYQSPAWLDSICAKAGCADASRFYETADGRQFLLPLVRRSGLPSPLTPAASLPASWGIGGLIASGSTSTEDIALIFADLARLPFLSISIRPNPRLGPIWAAAQPPKAIAIPRLAHVLDLEGGFDHVWTKRFKKETRSQVRKAERAGVVVESDATGRLLPVFYNLLHRSVERWARQQHEPLWLARWRAQQRDPLHKFQFIAKHLGEACRIWVAWVNGQPAAASMVLQYGNVNDSRGAMDKELAAPTCANDLLQKLTIEEACRAGCRYYHLGESGMSASLAHYKERFGAVAYPYAEYRLERLPISRMDQALRRLVKRLIGFKDVSSEGTVR